jgi:hypothetical protein
VVTTANGAVARWRIGTSEHDVLADGFDQLYGVDLAADGTPSWSNRAPAGCWPSGPVAPRCWPTGWTCRSG